MNSWVRFLISFPSRTARGVIPLSTVHDRFQEWRKAGVFKKLWRAGLLEYDAKIGLD